MSINWYKALEKSAQNHQQANEQPYTYLDIGHDKEDDQSICKMYMWIWNGGAIESKELDNNDPNDYHDSHWGNELMARSWSGRYDECKNVISISLPVTHLHADEKDVPPSLINALSRQFSQTAPIYLFGKYGESARLVAANNRAIKLGQQADIQKQQLIDTILSTYNSYFKTPLNPKYVEQMPTFDMNHLQDMLQEIKSDIAYHQKMRQFEMEQQQDKSRTREMAGEIADMSPEAARDTYTRFIWGNNRKVSQAIKSGLKMNSDHGSLPKGWFYLHVGDEGWVASLHRDYGREGSVCEVEISNLPEGFFVIGDVDIMDATNTPFSAILVSRQNVIPPECIRIVSCQNTQDVARRYPSIMNEFPDEHPG